MLLAAECLLSIQAASNYRSLVPVRRFQSNRRYKDYRTMNPQPQQRVNGQSNCLRYYHTQQRHLIRPRSTLAQSEDKHQCVNVQLNERIKREKQWHNIAEIKRDLEMNPMPQKAESSPPEQVEPPTPPKPRPKPKTKPQKKQKKVQVEMVKITAIDPNNQEMHQPPMMGPGPPPGYMGPPPGYMGPGPPPGYMGPPPLGYGPVPPPMGPIPRWISQGF